MSIMEKAFGLAIIFFLFFSFLAFLSWEFSKTKKEKIIFSSLWEIIAVGTTIYAIITGLNG